MQLQTFAAQDSNGNVQTSPTVYIYALGTTNPISGLEDENGAPLTNPFTGGADGRIVVAAPTGVYDMRVVKGAFDSTQVVQFIDLDAQVAAAELAENNASSSANAAAASAAAAAVITNISQVQTFTNPLQLSSRVAMTAAASGSNGIQVLDNVQNNMGLNNFTLNWKGSLPDYTPSADQTLRRKHDGTNGYILSIRTTGVIRLQLNGFNYDSTVAMSTLVSDGNVAEIEAAITRETESAAGQVLFFVNGVQLGTAVVIAAHGDLDTELVTNGTFDANIDGWSGTNATLSYASGKLRISTTANFSSANQSIVTVVGATYLVTAVSTFVSGSDRSYLQVLSAGVTTGNTQAASGIKSLLFTAGATSTEIRLGVTGSGSVIDFDNASVKRIETASTTATEYIMGTSAVRTAGTVNEALIYNRALSAAEVLSLCVNGVDLADVGASQIELASGAWINTHTTSFGTFSSAASAGFTASTAGGVTDARVRVVASFVAGKKYRITFLPTYSGVTSLAFGTGNAYSPQQIVIPNTTPIPSGAKYTVEFNCGANANSAVFFVSASAGGSIEVAEFSALAIGTTAHYNAQDAQSNTGQIFDSSGNRNHALLPAAGATVLPRRLNGEVRWTNTWDGTNELQYIGGVNQAILPANTYIESIIGTVSGATPHDIIIGDGSDTDRYVTITTGLAAGTTSFALASRTTDGTNLKLTVDPDTNATMTIAWTITYRILE